MNTSNLPSFSSRESMIFCLGAPRSGLNLMAQCLRTIGFTLLNSMNHSDAVTINSLLINDLALAPLMSSPMPSGWLESDAAGKARERIAALLNQKRSTTLPCFLSDPLFCRTLPLWLEMCKKIDLDVNCIHILRHPWEVAQSLASTEKIGIFSALVLWLSYTREAGQVLEGRSATLITFDQILANPVSTLSFLSHNPNLALLDIVRPSLKNHYMQSLPKPNKITFASFDRIYNQLRVNQYLQKAGPQRKVFPERDIQQPFSNSGLVDSLLHIIGQYEKKTFSHAHARPISENTQTLVTRMGLDSNSLTSFSLLQGQWQKINLPVEQANLLELHELILEPLNKIGIVSISTINLLNRGTGQVVWSANKSADFDKFEILHQALRLPDQDKLVVMVTGDGAVVRVRFEKDVLDCPLEVEVWIKASTGLDVLRGEKYTMLGWNDSSIQKLCANEWLLHNHKLPRMLLPIWPETLGNSTSTTMEYLAKHRNKMLKTKSFAQKSSYKLPTYLVCFPRSGSNFVQTVIEKSSGLRCCSFYSPRPVDHESVLSFKSHALSPDYLCDEIKRYMPDAPNPVKIILLRRDPRDVMISFYEFVLNLKQITIKQEDFLHDICYHYAFDSNPFTVQSSRRKTETIPMNIMTAYHRHIESWISKRPIDLDILDVSYEKIVCNPEIEFKRIFEFLEISTSLDINSLGIKVSQYSEEKRPRAIAYGWKMNSTHTTLITSVDESLKEQIKILGYA